MTRERAKELLPVIQAFADGKTIQYRSKHDTRWEDADQSGPSFVALTWNDHCEYRIKPEPREFWHCETHDMTWPARDSKPTTCALDYKCTIIKLKEVLE